jgi:large subunit ribosomal protein L21
MAYAIIKTGGKQYRVSPGDVIEVEKLVGDAGSETTFSEVLLVTDGADIKAGDALKGTTVVAEVLEQFKGPKVLAFKYRRRKGYHRTVGHRRKLTRLKIKSISARSK